ncbi:MAG: hypothetical protein BWY06_02210 [Candidatus Latescibacteria bacterium ADurb.Bin168]|nr:MAG: hypothetical protein BWY06_02210 [Candidatus Latescibacteria bacterium ADurb.Bin168]
MLRWCTLVVAVLDIDPDLFQCHDGITAQVGCNVKRGEVEISTPVKDLRWRLVLLEVEELELGADVECESHVMRTLQGPLEYETRVTLVRCPVRLADLTKHAGNRMVGLRAPGKYLETGWDGNSEHVALIRAREAFNGGAIKTNAVNQRVFQLINDNGDAFQKTQNVGEPKANELDLVVFRLFDDVACISVFHGHP